MNVVLLVISNLQLPPGARASIELREEKVQGGQCVGLALGTGRGSSWYWRWMPASTYVALSETIAEETNTPLFQSIGTGEESALSDGQSCCVEATFPASGPTSRRLSIHGQFGRASIAKPLSPRTTSSKTQLFGLCLLARGRPHSRNKLLGTVFCSSSSRVFQCTCTMLLRGGHDVEFGQIQQMRSEATTSRTKPHNEPTPRRRYAIDYNGNGKRSWREIVP